MIYWDNQNKYVWGKDRQEDLLELFNERIDCLRMSQSKYSPVTVQFSSEGVQPTAVRVSIQVEKSIWFYVWSKSIDWEIRALTESEPYRWVSLKYSERVWVEVGTLFSVFLRRPKSPQSFWGVRSHPIFCRKCKRKETIALILSIEYVTLYYNYGYIATHML